MQNNFDLIKPLLNFTSKDDFYFLQILQRKKDHKDGMKVSGANNNSRLVKAYYVKSLEHMAFIENEVIQLCQLFNARAGINLNKRSFEHAALQHLKKVTDQIINKDYESAYKAYSSVAGIYLSGSDKRWIIDIDDIDEDRSIRNEIGTHLSSLKPVLINKVVAEIPSKNGWHLITTPFDVESFRKAHNELEIHKNNPTNLYCP